MPIQTTCIGAYPKPDYVPMMDWFKYPDGGTAAGGTVTRLANRTSRQHDAKTEALYVQATQQAIADQIEAGIDVPTDGEQRRENYIHYHCRHLHGIDFEKLTRRSLRDGAYSTELPTIMAPIRAKKGHFLDRDFRVAQAASARPIKLTLPGPTTIMDTTANAYYQDERQLAYDLADALNVEIRALAAAGCRFIQIDEPLFARNVARALDVGIECLARCFHGLPDDIVRVMHMCCGYPGYLDDQDYHKADPHSYFALAAALDAAEIDQISIEDAHRHNDLRLLDLFRHKTVIFGAVAIAKSQLEPVDEIVERLRGALDHIDRERLIAAPDCGLALLGRDLARQKLAHLCQAANSV